MSTFTEFKRQVYRAVQDDPDSPFRFDDDIIAEGASFVFQEYVRNSGKDQVRIELSLVDDQRAYPLPTDVGRVSGVWVLPKDRTGDTDPLYQIDSLQIPPTDLIKGTVTNFALNTAETPGVVTMILNPVPDRNDTDAIIVEYDINTKITTGTTLMPFPDQFTRAFVHLTAAYMLSDMDDDESVKKATFFEKLGREELFKAGRLNSILQTHNYGDRIMP